MNKQTELFRLTFSQVPSSSKLVNYEFKYFSDETKLMELLQNGPVATWLDVGEELQHFGSGVYYNPGLCGNNEDEAVPPECARDDGSCTCLRDCKRKMPQHCDRCVKMFVQYMIVSTLFISRFSNVPRHNAKGLFGHAVTVVGYGTDR